MGARLHGVVALTHRCGSHGRVVCVAYCVLRRLARVFASSFMGFESSSVGFASSSVGFRVIAGVFGVVSGGCIFVGAVAVVVLGVRQYYADAWFEQSEHLASAPQSCAAEAVKWRCADTL